MFPRLLFEKDGIAVETDNIIAETDVGLFDPGNLLLKLVLLHLFTHQRDHAGAGCKKNPQQRENNKNREHAGKTTTLCATALCADSSDITLPAKVLHTLSPT